MNKRPGKRSAVPLGAPFKKRKLNQKLHKARRDPQKNKLDEIQIPVAQEEDVELSDQDLVAVEDYGKGLNFLETLDRRGISRGKREVERLHKLSRPNRRNDTPNDLPPLSSDEEGDLPRDLELDSELSASDLSEISYIENRYAATKHKRHISPEQHIHGPNHRLPIKLADGTVKHQPPREALPIHVQSSDSEEDENEAVQPVRDDVATGARFGRAAVIDLIQNPSRRERVHAAKAQIADICQEIISDPENSLGLLRRLHTFSLKEVTSPTHSEPVSNDPLIRKLSLLSQLAVFKDITPGYRIRELTDKEKAEKVSQMVARTREWEQGLVAAYQAYLRLLEAEVKEHTDMGEVAMQCMCTLLTELTHFNFRVNLMSCIVNRLGRRNMDETWERCFTSVVSVFRADLTGSASLDLVRLLNKTIKDKKYKVHPILLSCFDHLRLKRELGTRASSTKADKEATSNETGRHGKGKSANQPHLSKKARKVLKEKKEIMAELREAEAEVDKEERAVTQTETLKLVFVLYFGILKDPASRPLLPAALTGITKFAHLINIDFFRDLMSVLKNLIQAPDTQGGDMVTEEDQIRQNLLCIVTAFELLSGQGEALNIDLDQFIIQLYALIPSLSLFTNIDRVGSSSPQDKLTSAVALSDATALRSTSEIFFCALNLVFSPRNYGTVGVNKLSWRSAAFCKRLLIACMHWPSSMSLQALSFIGNLIKRDVKLEAMLTTEDRVSDGIYRPDVDDPQVCNAFATCFWELYTLRTWHCDRRVVEAADRLLRGI